MKKPAQKVAVGKVVRQAKQRVPQLEVKDAGDLEKDILLLEEIL